MELDNKNSLLSRSIEYLSTMKHIANVFQAVELPLCYVTMTTNYHSACWGINHSHPRTGI